MTLLQSGDRAPILTLRGTEGRVYSLDEACARGPVLLTFFQLDCQACDISYLVWDSAHEAFAGDRFQLWAIGLDAEADAAAFWEKSGVSFPVLFDDGTSAAKFGLVSTPSHVLVNPDGTVHSSFDAFDRVSWNTMVAAVAEQLGQPPISIAPGEAPDFRPGCTLHS